jgi:hypothetical protein
VPGPDGDTVIERRRGYTWRGAITASDERLSGTHYYSWDADTYTMPDGTEGPTAWSEGHRIENDAGAWQGSATAVSSPGDPPQPAVLVGEGAYAGLGAILGPGAGGCFFDFAGVIMEIPAPPVPYTGG